VRRAGGGGTTTAHLGKIAVAAVALVLLTSGQLVAWSATPPSHPSGEASRSAGDRLRSDAGSGLRVTRGSDGLLTFAGVTAGQTILNPEVRPATPVRAAARAHLDRYGAAFGTARPGSSLRVLGTARTASHQHVVRFQQSLGGVPVMGGEVVVAMRPDRQPSSVLAMLSSAGPPVGATVTRDQAAGIARRTVAAAVKVRHLPVRAEGRWVWDPRLLGATTAHAARGVWRFTVGDGVAVHREVLVDDRSGEVLLDVDAHQEALDRIVCDHGNMAGPLLVCTTAAAFRNEGSGPAGLTDVDQVFDHMGSTSTFYQAVGGIDLTTMIGVSESGVRKLAASVRYCESVTECPMENAFWTGTQMYFGAGFTVADDVVAHEATHGVVDRTSHLAPYGQAGAINESLADVMGEIVDHRNGLVPADASWLLGEDLFVGSVRNMSNPPSLGDPDRLTSPLYQGTGLGEVHNNAGVGNKAAYLISQGGAFNGQTITGIDVGDEALTRTAELYYDAIVRLTSFSGYAQLANVLEQTCQDFVAGGLHGFTQDHCVNIGRAVLATEMRAGSTPPPPPPQPPALPSAASAVQVRGGLGKAVVTWKPPVTNAATVSSYLVATGDTAMNVPATTLKAVMKSLAQKTTYVFTLTPVAGSTLGPATSVTAKATTATLKVSKSKGRTVLRGKLAAGSKGLKGQILKVLVEKKGRWVKVGKVKTAKRGEFTFKLSGTKRRTFRVRFLGGLGLMGVESSKRRL
jgi:hypothetical protein